MDEDSPPPRGQKRSAIFVDVPPSSKIARVSKSSLVPRRGGLMMSSSRAHNTTSHLPSQAHPSSVTPSILEWSYGEPEHADDSVLVRLDALETVVRRTHDDLLNRIGSIRQDYCNQLEVQK
jgi:hypothetical protein